MPHEEQHAGSTQNLTLNISGCMEALKLFELSGQQTLSAPYELSARFAPLKKTRTEDSD